MKIIDDMNCIESAGESLAADDDESVAAADVLC